MYENYSAQAPYGAVYGQPMYGTPVQPNYYDPSTMYGYAPGSGVQINPCNVRGISTTSKEDDELLKTSGTKNFQITALDIAKSKCNHKDQNGLIKVEILDAESNLVHCDKCGENFHLIKPSQEAVEELVGMFLDLFQSIKTAWLTPPKEFAESVYTIQCLIKQVPEMYKAAQRDWNAGQKAINNQYQPTYAGGYYNNALGNIPQIQQGFYGQPMYGAPPVQTNYQFVQPGQPMMNNYYGQQMMQQPMPVGGNMPMQSEFVQGGIVPPTPQQQSVPITSAIPFAQQATPAPTMTSVPQPGQPINQVPPQSPRQVTPQQAPANNNTSTASTTVSI